MNKEIIQRNTEAHGWLGLIISALLFVVFFTGSISFFRHDIEMWSLLGHYHAEAYTPENYVSPSEAFDAALAGRAIDPDEPQIIYPPTDEEPFYRAYVYLDETVAGHETDYLIIEPTTGEVLGDADDFFLADFMYILHYSLNLPYGGYLIGFVTLFFLFTIFSGVLIHAKDMVKGFFRYRSDGRKRSQLLDFHNIVGVISLPYALMFAVTGLIFNLVIIYQIAFAVILYQGNTEALLEDAGIVEAHNEWQNQPWLNPPIDRLYEAEVEKWGTVPNLVRVNHWGDASATMEMYGPMEEGLNSTWGVSYNLADGSTNFEQPGQDPNAVTQGIGVVTALHFGNFAGLDLRILYFLLGVGVCALIVTGNLLWVGQREKALSSAKVAFIGRFTLACSAGLAVATGVAFLAERLLPLGLADRAGAMVNCFVAALLLSSVYIWFAKDRRIVLIRLLQATCALCLLIALVDVLFFSDALEAAIANGHGAVVAVDVTLFLAAILIGYISLRLSRKDNEPSAEDSLGNLAAQSSPPIA